MFRDRATTKPFEEDLDRPLRLVSVPAFVGLLLALLIIVGGGLWLFGGQVAVRVPAAGVIVNPPENVEVVTTVSGVVQEGPTAEGQTVSQGDPIALIRTPDGKTVPVPAPTQGTVVSEGTSINAPVQAGEVIATLAHDEVPMIGIVFAPTSTIPGITVGDRVTIQPTSADPATAGVLTGTVATVTALPVSADRVQSLVTDDALSAEIMSEGTVHEITVELTTQPGQPSELVWQNGPGLTQPPTSGEVVSAEIIIAEQSPWQALVSGSG